MKLDILGTTYNVKRYGYKEKPIFEARSCDGYCDPIEKEIAVADHSTHPAFKDESEEYWCKSEMVTLRHEIVHAFLNESGLMESSLQYNGGWARNEEMVDWITCQFNKIMECFKKADCL
jgi:hypothetical protein